MPKQSGNLPAFLHSGGLDHFISRLQPGVLAAVRSCTDGIPYAAAPASYISGNRWATVCLPESACCSYDVLMEDADKFPCVMTPESLGYMISFELGQVPRSVMNDFVGRDSFKRDRAKERVTARILKRFEGLQVRCGPPLDPHDGSASGPRQVSPPAP